MPRRVSLAVLLGLVVVSVLSFGISAAAAPGDIVVPEGVVPKESTVPVAVPPVNAALGEGVVTPAEPATALPAPAEAVPAVPVAPQEEGTVPESGATPTEAEQKEAITAEEESASSDEALAPAGKETTSEEEEATSEDVAPEDATEETAASEEAAPEENDAAEGGELAVEEASDDFEEMLREAEAADGAYKNALSEENRLNNEIARTRADLTAAEDSLEESQESLEDRASEIYKHGQEGFVSVLLEAEDFRQFANLVDFWVQLLEEDQNEVESWRGSKDELEQTTEELEAQLQSWEATREEATDKKEQAETRVEDAEEFFASLDTEAQEEIEEQRDSEAQLALDHAEKMIREAAQNESATASEEPEGETAADEVTDEDQARQVEEAKPAEITDYQPALQTETEGATENEQPRQDEQPRQAEPADDRSPEEEQTRQAKVAQAVADTIREWPAIKEQVKQASGEAAKERGTADEAAPPSQENSAAEQLAAAAEKQAAAQDQAKQAAEQTAKEKQATEDAAGRAQEAEQARLAAEQAPEPEKEQARSAAEEAQRQAGFAAELASKEKQAAEEIAKQAAQRLTTAEEEISAAQMAAANNPLATPLPAGAGSGVLGEAKGWLGVPYDYSHMAGQTRKAVDCSAFTAAVYSKFGIMLPDSPAGQLGTGTPVSGPAKAGDLVFFSEDGSGVPTHVGIANGDGTLTHSSSFTGEVSVTDMDYINGYMGARRLI